MTAFDEAAEPIFVHDRQFRVLRCNPAYAARAGLPMQAIIGRPYWKIFPKLEHPPSGDLDASRKDVLETGAEFTTAGGDVFLTRDITAHGPSGEFWYSSHAMENITERRQLENDLTREKQISDTIIESAPGAFFMIDETGSLLRWNKFLSEETGLSDAQLRGASILSTILEEDRPLAAAKFMAAFATGYADMEVRVATQHHGIRYFLKTARRFLIDGVPYVAGYCIDVTARRQAEDALAKEKSFFEALVESAPGAFYVVDQRGDYYRWNSYLNRLTGLSDKELNQRASLLTIVEEDRPRAAAAMRAAFDKGYAQAEVRIVTHDRGIRLYFVTTRRFQVADATYIVGIGVDTTDRSAKMAELEHEAHTDSLTQVANRGRFFEVARDEFARCRRYGHPLSLWMLDIDHFKDVNDAFGHEAGDAALRSLVARSRETLRDWDVMGRMGGEEFAVLLPETGGEQALQVAERLRQMVAAARFPVGNGSDSRITISIGVATSKQEDCDVEALLRRADRALYCAKNTGRDKVFVAEEEGAAPG